MHDFSLNTNGTLMEFSLNEKERQNLKEFEDAVKTLYGHETYYIRTFCFTPTGIGDNIEVIIRSKEKGLFEVKKDITDYDSW